MGPEKSEAHPLHDQTMSVYVPNRMAANIRQEAAKNGISVSTLIRIAISRLLGSDSSYAPVQRYNGDTDVWEAISYDDEQAMVGARRKRKYATDAGKAAGDYMKSLRNMEGGGQGA